MSEILPTILVTIFGSSTWLAVNAVWMELPLLVDVLPEKWNLPSYLSLIVQLGDVAALVVGLGSKVGMKHARRNLRPVRVGVILLMMGMAGVLMVVLAMQWHVTDILFGQDRSVALFCLFFLLSMYCSGTNLLFLPHMISFDAYLVTPFFIGMGVSALVPSLLSLVQGVDSIKCIPRNDSNSSTTTYDIHTIPPRFGVSVFLWLMAGWLVLCVIAFLWLTLKHTAHQHRSEYSPATSQPDLANADVVTTPKPNHLSTRKLLLLLVLTGWVCVWMNSILPSIQIYAVRPYGPMSYHLALTLGNLANPAACVLAMYVHPNSLPVIGGCTVACGLMCAYIVMLAAMSPSPVLVHSWFGALHSIAVNVCVSGLLAYLRAVVAQIIRESDGDSGSRLFWCGAATQFGSVFGAVIVFPIVNVLQLFHQADQCSPAVF